MLVVIMGFLWWVLCAIIVLLFILIVLLAPPWVVLLVGWGMHWWGRPAPQFLLVFGDLLPFHLLLLDVGVAVCYVQGCFVSYVWLVMLLIQEYAYHVIQIVNIVYTMT